MPRSVPVGRSPKKEGGISQGCGSIWSFWSFWSFCFFLFDVFLVLLPFPFYQIFLFLSFLVCIAHPFVPGGDCQVPPRVDRSASVLRFPAFAVLEGYSALSAMGSRPGSLA